VPTLPEILRVKAYLIVQRNQVRDYLDLVALAERLGRDASVEVLAGIDGYYTDRSGAADSVLTALVTALAEPRPRDTRVTRQLPSYKRLDPKWHDWSSVVDACRSLSDRLLRAVEDES
jgi:predicted nucleotidyltransferase component of viral defense system